jgi:hypothetical protein
MAPRRSDILRARAQAPAPELTIPEIIEQMEQLAGNEEYHGSVDRMHTLEAAIGSLRVFATALRDDGRGFIREIAVTLVDGKHGYTFEFSASPQAHRDEYDEVERALRAALSVAGCVVVRNTGGPLILDHPEDAELVRELRVEAEAYAKYWKREPDSYEASLHDLLQRAADRIEREGK